MQMFEKKISNFCVLDNAIMQDSSLSLEARGDKRLTTYKTLITPKGQH